MLTLFIRTLIIYIFLVIAMRMGGKRQIGELQISELVTALLLSEIAALPIGHEEIPITYAIVPILTVICVEIICAFVVTKSQPLKKLFDGTPSVLIRKGKLDKAELGRARMGLEELLSEARLKGISDISDLEYAILEQNGKLSVFEKAKKGEKETGIAHAIIVDGSVSEHGLSCVSMSKSDLDERIKSKKTDINKVFLYTVNDAGEENWIFRSQKKGG